MAKWRPISTFNKSRKKPVLVQIESSSGIFIALARFRKRLDGFSWYVSDGVDDEDISPWHEKCVNWWSPVDYPKGYEK